MGSERHARVKKLFLAACDLAGPDRVAFLEEACADDGELRAGVEALLDSDAGRTESEDPLLIRLGALGLPALDGDQPPESIGGYRIVRKIGEGGMGVVFEAEQAQPRRRVALKVLQGIRTESSRRRFEFEVEVLGRLEHPGIARVYEASSTERHSFFVMELIDGEPLLDYARGRNLSIRQKLKLLASIADAVHHAHQQGVIHRDLKPGNILVEASGQPKVLDFGVARATESDRPVTRGTRQGELIGTLPYMSPEQTAGDPDLLDVRSDVYALGVILYELLIGELPYDLGERPLLEAARVIREQDPARLGTRDRHLGGDVDTIVRTALAKEKSHRYPSAAQLAADLRRYLKDEPILARPTTLLYQVHKFARRNRALVTGLVIAFLAMLTATVMTVRQAGIASRNADLASDRSREAVVQANRARLAATAAALEASDARNALEQLEAVNESARGWEWYHLHGRLDRSIAAMECEDGIAGGGFLEDGTAVRLVTRSGRLVHWDPVLGESRERTRLEGDFADQVTFLDDGACVLGVSRSDGRRLTCWDAASGRRIADSGDLGAACLDLATSPDERWVVAAGGRALWFWDRGGSLKQVEIEPGPESHGARGVTFVTGSARVAVGGHGALAYYDRVGRLMARNPIDAATVLCLTPGGRGDLLALGDESHRVLIGRLRRDGRWPGHPRWEGRIHSARGHLGPVNDVAFGPDDDVLASVGGQTVRLWDTRSGEQRRVLAGHDRTPHGVAFNDRGDRILSYSRDGEVRLWSMASEPGAVSRRIETRLPRDFTLTRDGRNIVLATARGFLELWDTNTADRVLHAAVPVQGQPSDVTAVAVSPDSSRLAAGHGSGSLALHAIATGLVEGFARTGPSGVLQVRFHPSGDRVACVLEDGSIQLRGVPDLQPVAVASETRTVLDLGFTGNGSQLWVVRPDRIELLDAGSLESRRSLEVAPEATCAAMVERTNRLAVGRRDGSVQLWALDTLAMEATFGAAGSAIRSIAFTQDGKRLATGHEDSRIRLWDVSARAPTILFHDHTAPVEFLRFSPDDTRMFSAAADDTIRIRDTRADRFRLQDRARRAADLAAVKARVAARFRDGGDPPAIVAAIRNDPDLSESRRRAALDLARAHALGVVEREVYFDFETQGRDGNVVDQLDTDGAQPGILRGDVRLERGVARFPPLPVAATGPASIEIPGTRELGRFFTLAVSLDCTGDHRQRIFSSYGGAGPVPANRLVVDLDPQAEVIRYARVLVGDHWTSPVEVPESLQAPGFQHLAVTYDDGRVQLYVNGQALALENHDFPPRSLDSPVNLRFGEDSHPGGGGVDEQFEGRVDDLVVLGRVLEPEEVAALAAGGPATIALRPAELAVHYDFEAATADALTDRFTSDGSQDAQIHRRVTVRDGAGHMRRRDQVEDPCAIEVASPGHLGQEFTLAARVTLESGRATLFGTADRHLMFEFEPGTLPGDLRLEFPDGTVVTHSSSRPWTGPHHFAATHSVREVRLYVDGEEVEARHRTGVGDDVDLGDRSLFLGSNRSPDPDRNFEGTLDEVLILSRALDAGEIAALARDGFRGEGRASAETTPTPRGRGTDGAPVDLGDRRELFVDRFLIESMTGTTLELGRPRDAGEVFRFDRPWEGGFSTYSTVIREADRFLLYYRGLGQAGHDGTARETTCVALSGDGVHWERPSLGRYEVQGTRDNNVVLADAAPVTHNFSPFLDSHPDVEPEHRFKALGGNQRSGLIAYTSPDGLHWTRLQEEPVFRQGVFDSQNVSFWSEHEQRYLCYFRTWSEGGFAGFRTVSRTTSRDFLQWTAPIEMGYGDTPPEHLYTNQTHPYFRAPHLYVATAARFLPGRRVLDEAEAEAVGVHPRFAGDCSDPVLLTSRGGADYDRTFLESWIRPGPDAANWVSRANYPALNLVPTGAREMSLYLNQHYAQPTAHLRRYAMRLDGLASVSAPYRGGEMLTRPFTFRGSRLEVNYATSAAGGIRVEVLDRGGAPIPGFSRQDAVELVGDEVDAVARWNQGPDVSGLAGSVVRLRFVMKDADLYSMRFHED